MSDRKEREVAANHLTNGDIVDLMERAERAEARVKELIALIHEMKNTQIDQIEGLREAERCIKTLIEACKDSEARTERAEARVKELETAIMEWGKHISKHKLSTIYRDMIEEKWEKVHIEERNK